MYLPQSEPHLSKDTFATQDQTSAILAFTSIHPDGHRNEPCELGEAAARAAPPLQRGIAGAPWGCHRSIGMQVMQTDDEHAAAHSLHAPGVLAPSVPGLATPSEERAEAHSVCAGRLRAFCGLVMVAGGRIRLCLCITLVLLPVGAYAIAVFRSL